MNRVVEGRPLRADAARNVDKIITAARKCFREHGPEVPLQTIAVTAGVGPATLFRNFADKEELVLAALHRQLGLLVDPVIEEALANPDAADGLFHVIEALMGVASEEANLLGAVAGMEAGSDAWRRPVALVEDAIRTERPHRPLPPQSPLPGSAFDTVLG
jgi:AcrR family transcriptional regulator